GFFVGRRPPQNDRRADSASAAGLVRMTGPPALAGVKVIDVAINYAGPSISMYLADQGAEVIKIERRVTGDTARRSVNTRCLKRNSRHFMAINRGKRGMTLDITKPEGQEIARELAR